MVDSDQTAHLDQFYQGRYCLLLSQLKILRYVRVKTYSVCIPYSIYILHILLSAHDQALSESLHYGPYIIVQFPIKAYVVGTHVIHFDI